MRRPTQEEIDRVLNACADSFEAGRSRWPGESYEGGVEAAIRWLTEGGPDPMGRPAFAWHHSRTIDVRIAPCGKSHIRMTVGGAEIMVTRDRHSVASMLVWARGQLSAVAREALEELGLGEP